MFTLKDIDGIFPDNAGNLDDEKQIEHIMTDSRSRLEQSLFVPIIGERFDGHTFLEQAIQQGAIASLWDRSKKIPHNVPASFVFFLVDDTVKALQRLAKTYREAVNPIVIGITGSNGKTTTKDLVHAVLKTSYQTHCTSGNYNNEIGLPLTILSMDRQTEVLVLEMGMSGFGEIELLSKIAQPDYAIITNVGESHIEHLGTREGIAKAKLEIQHGLQEDGTLLIDGDEPLLQLDNVFSIGFSKQNDLQISNVRLDQNKTIFQINNHTYEVPLLGKHHAKNAAFAIEIGMRLALTNEQIIKGIKALKHTSMRFEQLTGKNGVTIINDAYNASPTSMKAAIDVLKQLTGYQHKVVVLGDILELGEYSKSLHRSVAEVIDAPIDTVYTFGENARIISEVVERTKQAIQVNHFQSRETLIDALKEHVTGETIILFKASRGMKFEQFIEQIID